MYKIKLVSDGEGLKGTVDFKHGDDSRTLKLALTRVKA